MNKFFCEIGKKNRDRIVPPRNEKLKSTNEQEK